MMWWWDGPHWTMMFWPIGLMIVCAVVMLLVMRGGWVSTPRQQDPVDILKQRFARGEIDRKEYEDGRRLLSSP